MLWQAPLLQVVLLFDAKTDDFMNDSLSFRKKFGLSQEMMARVMAVDRSMLALYETGRRPLNAYGEAYLTQALRVALQVPEPDLEEMVAAVDPSAHAQKMLADLTRERTLLQNKLDALMRAVATATRKKAWAVAMRQDELVQRRNITAILNLIEREADATLAIQSPEAILQLRTAIGSIEAQINYWQALTNK